MVTQTERVLLFTVDAWGVRTKLLAKYALGKQRWQNGMPVKLRKNVRRGAPAKDTKGRLLEGGTTVYPAPDTFRSKTKIGALFECWSFEACNKLDASV